MPSSFDLEHAIGTTLLIIGGVAAVIIGGAIVAAFAIGAARELEARLRKQRRETQ